MPKISIIVPVYKVESYLCRCVDSILAQTYSDFELLLIDDGSPDGCPAICDAYAEKDYRVVVIHQQNGGLSAARNAGIDWSFANSDSEWLTFIDSDDWVHPQYLELLLKAVSKSDAQISNCDLKRVSCEEKFIFEEVCVRIEKSSDTFAKYKMTAALFKKYFFLDVRFPEGKLFEDVATAYQVFPQSEQIAHITNCLYYYFINNNGIVQSKWSHRQLDEIEAYNSELAFLASDIKYKKLYHEIQRDYLVEIGRIFYKEQHSDICDTEKEYYRRIITKKAKRAYIKYYFSSREFMQMQEKFSFLEAAFPEIMKLYWYVFSKLNKNG